MKNVYKELFDTACEKMISEDLSMDVILAKINGKIYKKIFTQPEPKVEIRSISKPITCLCFGIAISMGFFKDGLNEKIYPYLIKSQCITNTANIKFIENWTLWNLFSMTIGFENKMLDSKHLKTIIGEDYGDVVLNSELHHAPGTYFLYSNASMYLASIVFQNATGINLGDFANEYLFSRIGVQDIYWKKSPQGYTMGCTGIQIYTDDLLKVAELLQNEGKYNNQEIVPSYWVKTMLTPQIETPTMYDEGRVLPKWSYGLNMWICKDGISYCDGTDGQYLILNPNNGLIVLTAGHQSNMKPITVCLKELLRYRS